MIDNVKFNITDKSEFENHLIDSQIIQLQSFIDTFTGELTNYPKRGKLSNIEVKITRCNAIINGSVHKYNNIQNNNGNHNHNDFGFCQVCERTEELENIFKLDNNTRVTNLEFGLNINLDFDPEILIDEMLLMYNFKNHNRNLKFYGRGDFKEFQKTDYSIKIYNKSKQYNIENEYILRVELKIVKTRLLKKLGISQFQDIKSKEVIERLFLLLVKEVNNLLIIDNYHNKDILDKHREKLIKYTNPYYWNNIRKNNSYKVVGRFKRDFNLIIEKYNLNKTHLLLMEKLTTKFYILLNQECYSEVA